MGERKVLNKYYFPTFDPTKILRRTVDKNKRINVRTMLPMSIRCNTCGTFIYKGTKFNSPKEDVIGETYKGIQIIRLYFKCTHCSAEIILKTDTQNLDYAIESGASRNLEPWRDDAEVADRVKKRFVEETCDVVKALENRAVGSKKDMDTIAALEELKSMKSRQEKVSLESMHQTLNCKQNGSDSLFEVIDEAIIKHVFSHCSEGLVQRMHDSDDEDMEGTPTGSLTTAGLLFNSSRTGNGGSSSSKPKFTLKPRNIAKKPRVGPIECGNSTREAGGIGKGETNCGLLSLCENYDSDESGLF